MIRLAEARAKAELRDIVTGDDAQVRHHHYCLLLVCAIPLNE
jgi:DNA replicative helicase MCM subunit Mcm2 (Cdc46/Mcm family)